MLNQESYNKIPDAMKTRNYLPKRNSHQISGSIYGHIKSCSVSNLSSMQSIQNTDDKNNHFIVDWQLDNSH